MSSIILKFSFDGVIRQYKDELRVATSEEERYRIACKAIQDVGRMSDVNPDKVVMLHEFVIAPLTSLMSTYNLVRNVAESFIWMSKECLDKVLTYLDVIRDVEFQTIGVYDANNTETKLHSHPAAAGAADELPSHDAGDEHGRTRRRPAGVG